MPRNRRNDGPFDLDALLDPARAFAHPSDVVNDPDLTLREKRATLTLAQFNEIDRKVDRLILAAANEMFLENTLRPLHTLFRRIGHIHHSHIV